ISDSIHPPLMSWLLGAFDALLPGTGLFVVFNAFLLFATLYAVTRLHDRVSWLAIPVAVALVLTPQVLIYQTIVWKDVLFANLAISGFACLAHALRRWPPSRAKLLLLALLLLALASLTRQNGLIVLLAGAIALA